MAAGCLQKDEYKELRVRKCNTYHGTAPTPYLMTMELLSLWAEAKVMGDQQGGIYSFETV